MKKKLKKLGKRIVIISVIFIFYVLIVLNSVQAFFSGTLNLYARSNCGELLKYKGEIIETYVVEYQTKSTVYPAYCLDKSKQGITEQVVYGVRNKDYIKDDKLWNYIVNGYPYKTKEELGCQTVEEAYMATQQAIYCYLYNYNLDDFEAIGEAGQRTLNALKQIVANAGNSKKVRPSDEIIVNSLQEQFTIDEKDKNYASKTYEVLIESPTDEYTATFASDEDTLQLKITDENNVPKYTFKKNEKFKVLVPLELMKKGKSIKLYIDAIVDLKRIVEGVPDDSNYQSYAITASATEIIREIKEDKYAEDEGSIKIIKQDEKTKERLEGVEFVILDENKQILYNDLKTDKNGEIKVEHLAPKTYYVQETKAKEGYLKKLELTPVTVDYNKSTVITIDNEKRNITQIVDKLPVTGE